ncbi:hypothetical protein ACOSQ4_014823 [Xanthoceras sorbifolium]
MIGKTKFGKALCDLAASVNLIPFLIFKKLGLGEIKATNVTLQLADHSVKYPHGIIEDVLVKVDKLYFSVDFVVQEMEEDVEIPLILGRPFLVTSRAWIDVHEGKLTLWVGDEKAMFNVLKATKTQPAIDFCFKVDVVKSLEVEGGQIRSPKESPNKNIVHVTMEAIGKIDDTKNPPK